MILEALEQAVTLALIVACFYLALIVYVRHWQTAWAGPMEKHRLSILCVMVFAVSAAKVSEDVLGNESGPFDEALLMFIHSHIPPSANRIFEIITMTGSSAFLFPLTGAASAALLLRRHRVEALLLAASVASGAIAVYIIKTAVGRARPTLWNTDWYWGSSFPSGHTLVVTAFATAASLCIGRICPPAYRFALPPALLWIALVGLSRLVLGVHWPTDVLTAACIGAFLPLAMNTALALRRA